MQRFDPSNLVRKPLCAAIVSGLVAAGGPAVIHAAGANPDAAPAPFLLAAACNPCNPCAKNPCNPCNPCAKNPCNPCNPCAKKNPCNPCAKSACNPCNPCAKNPCNPCAKNPCNPCNPCAKNPCKSSRVDPQADRRMAALAPARARPHA